MNWLPLTDTETLENIVAQSFQQPVVIFKHSTRCATSTMAKQRMEKGKIPDTLPCYFLDLIQYRHISNLVAETFSVYHESPQVLVIKNGECIFDESHQAIFVDEIVEQAG